MDSPAASTRPSATRTRSSSRNCPHCGSGGRSRKRTRRRVTQPVLAVLGEHSAPTFPERRELLLSWLPNVEPFDLPGATHCFTCRTRGGWRKPSPHSSRGTRSQHLQDRLFRQLSEAEVPASRPPLFLPVGRNRRR